MKDIDADSRIDTSQLYRTSEIKVRSSQLLEKGDLLFRARGQTNTVALFNGQVSPAIASAPLFHIRATGVLPEYLHWFLNLPITQRQLAELAVGTALQLINKTSFEGFAVSVPSIKIQKQIIEIASLSNKELELMRTLAGLKSRRVDTALLELAKNSH